LLFILLPCIAQAQIGIKAGANFSNVVSASQVNPGNQAGFVAGLYLAPPVKGIIGSRTELLFSKQGYSYASGTTSGNVNLDYLVIPQFMTINITKFLQIQLGGQMAFLLNAKADSSASDGSKASYGNVMSYYNKFDYGFGGGVELHPVGGWIIGARYNISMAKIYSSMETGQMPSFSAADAKNNLFQVYSGWTFGGNSKK
jgi:hypothetical protein